MLSCYTFHAPLSSTWGPSQQYCFKFWPPVTGLAAFAAWEGLAAFGMRPSQQTGLLLWLLLVVAAAVAVVIAGGGAKYTGVPGLDPFCHRPMYHRCGYVCLIICVHVCVCAYECVRA